MASIETIFSAIENAYRRTENKIMSLAIDNSKRERIIAQCMELFRPLYLDQPSMIGLEAYFRYLVHDASTLSDVPFNFLLTEDEKTDRIIQTFLDALKLITGEEQNARSVDEQQLLFHCEEELSKLGGCSVYIIKNCSSAPMTSDDRIAWNVVAGLFELTPRIVKILCASKEVIETRFREVDHIYYRVFRNSIRTREATPTEVSNALLDNLDERGFSFSQTFLDEIKLYVDTVYPKADLKEDRFVNDLVERVVHRYYEKKRSGMELNEECVPFYRRPNSEAGTGASISGKESVAADEAEEIDGTIDEYEAAGRPVIKNLLVVSLSTFPYRLNKCVYLYYPADSGPIESETYFYQQEPFPMRLKEQLKDKGEILMLTTPETLKVVNREMDGVQFRKSAQAYFIDSVKSIPGLNSALFKSVEVDQDNPIDAVSQVVEHLRAVKRANGDEKLQIHLGTNGGLRGNQLILEAVLSLLAVDGITVSPDHVWSMRAVSRDKWEVFNSAAEFKIFDFVSGINEFMNYGRTTSLDRFMSANRDLMDEAAKDMMRCIKSIAEGIQFCSLDAFERGLDELRNKTNSKSGNPYIEMFRENIKMNFHPLLDNDREVLQEIEWCKKKGFYQQAYTLIEAALPREFIAMGIIAFDESTRRAAEQMKKKGENTDSYIFNNAVLWHRRGFDTWGSVYSREWDNKIQIETRVNIDNGMGNLAEQFRKIMNQHSNMKKSRNGLIHAGESNDKNPQTYKSDLGNYIATLRRFYNDWKAAKSERPIMEVSCKE